MSARSAFSMKFAIPSRKQLLISLGGAALIGCAGASSSLWNNTLEESNTYTRSADIGAAGEIYQSFSLNGATNLRKIASDGTEEWRQVISEDGTSSSDSVIAIASGGVIAVHDQTRLVRLDADGTVLWRHQAVPADATITSLSRFHEGRFYLSFSTATTVGVMALDEQGNEVWSNTLGENDTAFNYYAPRLTMLDTGTLVITLFERNQARLYVFDAQGGLLREMTLDNEPWMVRVASNQQSAYVINGENLTKLAVDGSDEWTQAFPSPLHCDGGNNGELVCAYDIHTPLLDAFTRTPLVWIASDGTIRQTKTLVDTRVSGGSMGVTGLHYNGDNKWVVEEDIDQQLINPLPETYKSYTRYKVLTEQGTVLRTIKLKPTIIRYNICFFECPGRISEILSSSDSINAEMVTATRFYTAGTTSENSHGFVTAYALDPNAH